MATAFKQPQAAPLSYIDPADMPDLHAIPAFGRCMEPRLHDGDVLVFDKRDRPEPGDVVAVLFRREHAARYGFPGWVKRLVGMPAPGEDGIVVVEQLNPSRRYAIPSTHVAAVHKCIGTGQSAGSGRALFRLPAKREG